MTAWCLRRLSTLLVAFGLCLLVPPPAAFPQDPLDSQEADNAASRTAWLTRGWIRVTAPTGWNRDESATLDTDELRFHMPARTDGDPPPATASIRVRRDDSRPEEAGYDFTGSRSRRIGSQQWHIQTGLRSGSDDGQAANRVIASTTINGASVALIIDSDDALVDEAWFSPAVLEPVEGVDGCDGMVGLNEGPDGPDGTTDGSESDCAVPLPTGFFVRGRDRGVVWMVRPAANQPGSRPVRMMAAMVRTAPGDDLDAAIAAVEPQLQTAGLRRTNGRLLTEFSADGRPREAFGASGRVGEPEEERAFAAVWMLDREAQQLLLVLVETSAATLGEWQVKLSETIAPSVRWPAPRPPDVVKCELSGEYLRVNGKIVAAQLNVVLTDSAGQPVPFDGRPWTLQWSLRSQSGGNLAESRVLACSSSADGLATGRYIRDLRLPLGQIVNRTEGARLHVDVEIAIGDKTISRGGEVDSLFGP